MHLLTNTVKIFKLSKPTNLRSDVAIKIVVSQVQESELGDVVNGGRYGSVEFGIGAEIEAS